MRVHCALENSLNSPPGSRRGSPSGVSSVDKTNFEESVNQVLRTGPFTVWALGEYEVLVLLAIALGFVRYFHHSEFYRRSHNTYRFFAPPTSARCNVYRRAIQLILQSPLRLFLGITIVVGGQYCSWNAGLAAGFGSELIAVFFMGTAYICLCLCNAELTSSLPFAGGAYGLARVTLGLFPGFLIGCCESVEYIIYVASSAILLSHMVKTLTNSDQVMVPVYCLIFYIVSCYILITGGQLFWRFSSMIGVLSLLILLIYCFGSLPWTDLTINGPSPGVTGSLNTEPQWFIGGMSGFMKVLPLAAWFYVGVESLNMCSSVVYDPKTTIPIASICCILTLFATSIFVLFVCSSLPKNSNYPTSEHPTPFSSGFTLMFNISEEIAILFSIPATFATAFGFIFAYSRILIAMARSRLFPPLLTSTYGRYGTPYIAILAGSFAGYILCLVVYFIPYVDDYLYSLSILSGFLAYISQFVGYIIFKMRYDQRNRRFTNPLGIYAAIYGGIVFTVSALAVCGFQADSYVNVIATSILISIYTSYYFLYAKSRQTFSDEEKIFLPIHIVKFNDRKMLMTKKGRGRRGAVNSSSIRDSTNSIPKTSTNIVAQWKRVRGSFSCANMSFHRFSIESCKMSNQSSEKC